MKSNILKFLISLLLFINRTTYAQSPEPVQIFNVVASYDQELANQPNYINDILTQIATANLAFERSGLPIYLNLLDVLQTNESLLQSSYTNSTILHHMHSLEQRQQQDYPNMHFWVHFTNDVGYQSSSTGQGSVTPDARFSLNIKSFFVGSSVVRISPWINQLTGCDNQGVIQAKFSTNISTFAHEVGHNFGMNHDRTTDALRKKPKKIQGDHFGYGNQDYYTLMAYGTSYPSAKPSFTFSSPSIRFAGQPLGTKKSNVVRVLSRNASQLHPARLAQRKAIKAVESWATQQRYQKIKQIIKILQSDSKKTSVAGLLCDFKTQDWGDQVSSFAGELDPINAVYRSKKTFKDNRDPDNVFDQPPKAEEITATMKQHGGAFSFLQLGLLALFYGWRQRGFKSRTSWNT
jgi:hypothetical protein